MLVKSKVNKNIVIPKFKLLTLKLRKPIRKDIREWETVYKEFSYSFDLEYFDEINEVVVKLDNIEAEQYIIFISDKYLWFEFNIHSNYKSNEILNDYKSYNDISLIINYSNKQYRKLYSFIDINDLLKKIVSDNIGLYRLIRVGVVKQPYSIKYNDIIYLILNQYKLGMYIKDIHARRISRESTNIIVRRIALNGYICIYDYILYSINNDSWLILKIDGCILLVCIVYSKNMFVAIYVYVLCDSVNSYIK